MKFKLVFFCSLFFSQILLAQWSPLGSSTEYRIRNNTQNSAYFDFRALNGGPNADLYTNLSTLRLGVMNSGTVSLGIELRHTNLQFRTNNILGLMIQENLIRLRTNNIDRFRILGANIGVNISNPDAGFHIHQRMLKLTGLDPDYVGYGGTTILFSRNIGNDGNYAITYNHNVNGLNFWKPWPAIEGGIAKTSVLFLSDNGNVGINTFEPTANLSINGTVLIGSPSVPLTNQHLYGLYVQKGILAEKLKIALHSTTDWSDHVFSENYPLLTINEIATFIKINKHLPGVPSANQLVENKGYDVLQMDSILLMKIEELTLYLIELHKENQALSEKIHELQNELQIK